MCEGERIAVKAATLVKSRDAWIWWVRKICSEKVMFVAFGADLAVEHVWLMPVSVIRADGRFIIRADSMEEWDEYAVDLEKYEATVTKL